MSTQNQFLKTSKIAGQDLSDNTAGTGSIYKAITANSGTIAGASVPALGILQQGGESGEHINVGYLGEMKYTAGAAVTIGAELDVASAGYLATTTSGDFSVGKALETVTSGSVGRGVFNFITNPLK